MCMVKRLLYLCLWPSGMRTASAALPVTTGSPSPWCSDRSLQNACMHTLTRHAGGDPSALASNPSMLVQLKWELGSPVLGLLLRKWAPSDVYEVRSPLVQWLAHHKQAWQAGPP